MTTQPKIGAGAGPITGGGQDLGSVLLQSALTSILPGLLGTGNTAKRTASKDANQQANIAFSALTKPVDYAGQTSDILTQAAQAFAPALAGQSAAGLYNSTTLEQLRNESVARATAASSAAINQNETQRANAAANLASASLQANNTTVTEQTVDPVQALLTGGVALAAPSIIKGGKDLLGGIFGGGGSGGGTVFDPSRFIDDIAEPLTGAVSSGAGSFISNIVGGEFGGATGDVFGGISGLGGFDIGAKLLSGDFGGALASGIGYAFGGPVGGFVGNLVGGLLGCFLTTAVCETCNLPDDNEYLNTLRKFRDSYMMENYPELVTEYYEIAPVVTNYIKARPDSDEVFKKMFYLYIAPAVTFIDNGDYPAAMNIYTELVMFAKKMAGLEQGA